MTTQYHLEAGNNVLELKSSQLKDHTKKPFDRLIVQYADKDTDFSIIARMNIKKLTLLSANPSINLAPLKDQKHLKEIDLSQANLYLLGTADYQAIANFTGCTVITDSQSWDKKVYAT